MSNVSQFLHSQPGPKGLYTGHPGSNGFWRRAAFRLVGTHTWVAPKSGKIKIQALGAGSGGGGTMPGASGSFGEKTISIAAGQALTIVVGAGGTGVAGTAISGNGESTSISGTPVGGTPLTLVGATGVQGGTLATGTPGTATGPWDSSHNGAKSGAINTGSPSSGSPQGPGKVSTGTGGAGWFAGSTGKMGASTHVAGNDVSAGGGLLSPAPVAAVDQAGKSQPLWDLADADGSGGFAALVGGGGGVGSGGSGHGTTNGQPGGASLIGGGTGLSLGTFGPKAGPGAGGGASTTQAGGAGGDAIVFIFWDEVE
jgi:hypothetical protein